MQTKFIVPATCLVFFALAGFVSVRADTLDASFQALQTPSDSFPLKITKIYINGNKVTRPEIIRMYIGIDTGMTYDSVLAAAGKRRLLNTNLFSKVDVVPIRKNDGVNVYIIVTELFYVYPEGGGDYVVGKYGDTTHPLPIWYRLRLGLTIQNFRGSLETFSIRASVWDDRSLSVSWSKPFVPSPYYIGIGAGVHEYPDLAMPWNRFVVNGRLSGGRTLFGNSRISLSFVPTYSRVDTISNNAPVARFKEVYSVLGWSTDRRDRSFDPMKGWYVYTDALTNVLCTDYNRYVQVDGDLRLYHRGLFSVDRFAYRLQATLRSNDGGVYKGLYMGGQGSVRGYARDQFGLTGIMNDYAVLSAEYRFPIWTMPCFLALPCFDIALLSDYSDLLKTFYLRLDGAVIADAGHIWRDLQHPMTPPRENADGIGFGLRAMAPTLRRSLCLDVVWGIPVSENPLPPSYFSWKNPSLDLYLDTYF